MIEIYPGHEHCWNIYTHGRPDICSPIGRAQYMLTKYCYIANRSPDKWRLLCRYANTVQKESELLDLRHLAQFLENRALGLTYGVSDATAAIQAEQVIVMRSAPEYARDCGHDISPATSFLIRSEPEDHHLSQGVRNLILTYAYFFGSPAAMERFTDSVKTGRISGRDIAAACASIEDANLEWAGLDKMEGVELYVEERPAFQFDFKDSMNPWKTYPRFAMYQDSMPEKAVLLQNGTVLLPCSDDWDRWQSDLRRIDGTFTSPRYFMEAGQNCFLAEERVEITQDLAISMEDNATLTHPCDSKTEKRSVRERLRAAVWEVSQCPPSKEPPKGGEAR